MDFYSILNKIFFKKLPETAFYQNLPILMGTIRGGHTSAQNWINAAVLDFLEVEYNISDVYLTVIPKKKTARKALEPLDLRSILTNKYPFFGYITNHPGHAVNLKNRELFIFLRSPKKTYQSITVLAKYLYGYNDLKSINFSSKYLTTWSQTLEKMIKKKEKYKNNFYFLKSENIFKDPSKHITKIIHHAGLHIPTSQVALSIKNYDEKIYKFRKQIDKINPRKSYKKYYTNISQAEEKFINSLFINKLYLNQNKFYIE